MTVQLAIQGFGAMGQETLVALATRSDAEVVAILDVKEELLGRRVEDVVPGTPWGELRIQHPDDPDVDLSGVEVAVHLTTAFAVPAEPQICRLLEAGINVVTLCQELVYPVDATRDIADRIDACARANQVSVVAGGVNPGWILDLLPLAASLGCVNVTRVRARRVVDFSPYGPDEMVHIGAGLAPEDFYAGAASGDIGHIGLRESVALVAAGLGFTDVTDSQTKEPLLAERVHTTPFVTIEPGRVRGFTQRVELTDRASGAVVEMEMVGLLDVGPEDPTLGNTIEIDATPSMSLTVHGNDTVDGGLATAGVATNLVGPILAAAPGYHTVLSLTLERSRGTLRLA